MRFGESANRFWPRYRTWPSKTAFGSRIRRMIESAVTLLPDPDSPTIPSTSPARRLKLSPSTARRTPSSVRNETWRSRTSTSGGSVGPSSANAHPGVEQGVDDVNHGVRDDDEEGRVHHRRH